jgi:hypothetical protein
MHNRTMIRLLSLLLLNIAVNATVPASPQRLPFIVAVRGGGDPIDDADVIVAANSVSMIPSGGASYSSEVEAVKATVLKAAFESVRFVYLVHERGTSPPSIVLHCWTFMVLVRHVPQS